MGCSVLGLVRVQWTLDVGLRLVLSHLMVSNTFDVNSSCSYTLTLPSFRFHHQGPCFIDCHFPAASALPSQWCSPDPPLSLRPKTRSSLCFLSSSVFYTLPICKSASLVLLLKTIKNVKKLRLLFHTKLVGLMGAGSHNRPRKASCLLFHDSVPRELWVELHLHMRSIVLHKKPDLRKPNAVSWETQVLCLPFTGKPSLQSHSPQKQPKPKAASMMFMSGTDSKPHECLGILLSALPQPAGPGCPTAHRPTLATSN